MGRPPGKIHDQQFQMRVSDDFLKMVDRWRQKQEDEPSRAEAIRRLVEIGLGDQRAVSKLARKNPKRAKRAAELAEQVIDKHLEASPGNERDVRKRKLLKGPSVVRNVRKDHP